MRTLMSSVFWYFRKRYSWDEDWCTFPHPVDRFLICILQIRPFQVSCFIMKVVTGYWFVCVIYCTWKSGMVSGLLSWVMLDVRWWSQISPKSFLAGFYFWLPLAVCWNGCYCTVLKIGNHHRATFSCAARVLYCSQTQVQNFQIAAADRCNFCNAFASWNICQLSMLIGKSCIGHLIWRKATGKLVAWEHFR